MLNRMSRIGLMLATAGCLLGGAAYAADTVKIGVIEPLSGNAASVGAAAKAAN